MTTPRHVSVFGGRKFDRVPGWDAQNDLYLLRNLSQPVKDGVPLPTHKTHKRQTFFNQTDEGGCTGFSLATGLSFAPESRHDMPQGFCEFCYAQAKLFDDYPGENYEGSSVLGAMKGAKANNFIESYSWAPAVGDILAGIAFHGGGQFGINWKESMMNADSEGVVKITPGSKTAGGHAIWAPAYKTTKGGNILVELSQTWGQDWGVNGSCWIGTDDIELLMGEEGEFAVPVKSAKFPPSDKLPVHARVDPGT